MIFEEKYSIYLSFIIVLIGSLFAYLLIGQPPLIGIDDANITQVYAKNLSDGYGYVYTPGYERVEGSTSILWTFINAAAFSISSHPELIILVISFLLTIGSIYFVLLLFRGLSNYFNFAPNVRQAVISCALLSMP